MQKTCVLCGCKITDKNNSKEHVIPQAIGGRLSVEGFICKKCNDRTGQEWDSVLTKQLNPLSLIFGVVRERGEVPSEVVTFTNGARLEQHVDGSFSPEKPSFEEKKTNAGIEITITARSGEELNKMLNGIKKKYPQINLDALKQQAVRKKEYPEGLIHYKFLFVGKEVESSVIKTALSFAYNLDIPMHDCQRTLQYLKESKGKAPFGYYSQDIIANRPFGVPLHCVAILGDREEKLLLAYIEYFGFIRMLVCLSDQYKGKTISKTYAINPMTGREIGVDISFSLKNFNIQDLYDHKMYSWEMIQKACSDVIGPHVKETHDVEQRRISGEVVDAAIKNSGCREGEPFKKEHIEKITQEIIKEISPYILHMKNI